MEKHPTVLAIANIDLGASLDDNGYWRVTVQIRRLGQSWADAPKIKDRAESITDIGLLMQHFYDDLHLESALLKAVTQPELF